MIEINTEQIHDIIKQEIENTQSNIQMYYDFIMEYAYHHELREVYLNNFQKECMKLNELKQEYPEYFI